MWMSCPRKVDFNFLSLGEVSTNSFRMRSFFSLLLLTIFLVACHSGSEDYVFSKNRIGRLDKAVGPRQIPAYFPGDSIGKPDSISGAIKQMEIGVFDKQNHKQKLNLIFIPDKDSLKLVAVEILSDKYRTTDGLSLADSYGKWHKRYTLAKGDQTLRHLVFYIKKLNAALEIPATALPESLQNRDLDKVDPDVINPDAKPVSITLFFQ